MTATVVCRATLTGACLLAILLGGARGAAAQNRTGAGVRPPAPADSLSRDSATTTLSRVRWAEPGLMFGIAEHRINQGAGLEKTSGAVIGVAADVALGGPMSLRVQLLTGTLTKDTVTVLKDRSLSALRVDGGIQISPWLIVFAGGEARRYQAAGTERWLMIRAGGEASASLGGGPLHGFTRVVVLPLISIATNQGSATAPSFGIASETGIGLSGRRFSGSVLYAVERYDFPTAAGRREQFGALFARVSYRVGW